MGRKSFDSYNQLVSLFVVGCETVLTGSVFTLYYNLMQDTPLHKSAESPMMQIVLILMLCYFIAAMQVGVVLYKRKIYAFQIVTKIFKNITGFGLLAGIILYVGDFMDTWSWFYLYYLIGLFMAITLFRLTLRNILKIYRRKGGNIRYVVLVGSTENMQDLYYELTNEDYTGYRVRGYFDFEPNPMFPTDCQYLGRPEEVVGYLKSNPDTHYLFCSLPSRYSDIIFSLTFLCTLFPFIFVIVAVITKVTMPGPIFFRQKRNGLNDEEFYCYKFRSMRVNKEADTLQATKNDPRKTKWGNIMRKTNIDELPQFINVLKGDMSIVGPRPHMLKHTEEYSKLINKYMVRHLVKPGITGWSQVTGFRGETKELKDMEGRIRGDIWYIEHWSFGLDLFIIYKTVMNAIHGEKKAY